VAANMVLNRRSTVKDTMNRHCERSEAIHVIAKKEWIASLRSQ
jgi:hypothetical protein